MHQTNYLPSIDELEELYSCEDGHNFLTGRVIQITNLENKNDEELDATT